MGTTNGEKIGHDDSDSPPVSDALNSAFGALRAEYLRKEVFDLFTQPSYFPQLQSIRPCILVGGRGTGKTTVLKCLSYEGQAHLNPSAPVRSWPFIGLYWRIDTSVVGGFHGPELSDRQWTRLFIHYVNLMLTSMILDFAEWYQRQLDEPLQFSLDLLKSAGLALGISIDVTTLTNFRSATAEALLALEIAVNNLDPDALPTVSPLGRPIQYLIAALSLDGRMEGKTYSFLLDEYENLSNYQQRVFNTLIKHAGDFQYTFKVGMRETGLRERSTINQNEYLIDPADYAYIDITDRLDDTSFASFARQVCESRLQRLKQHVPVLESVDQLFPSLTEEAEALKLGVQEHNSSTRRELEKMGSSRIELEGFDSLSPLSAYLVKYWSESENSSILATLNDALQHETRWNTRLNNYGHAMLFTIRRRKRGYRKYYCGWNAYTKMANGNIRYLLQLVHEALRRQLIDNKPLDKPLSPEIQTDAAATIGELIVEQLKGASPKSADLTRLVLGLGRVFQVMAAQPQGHTPEVSQFRLSSEPDHETEELLTDAVMHLAVRRFTTDKMAAISAQIKDYSYQLHPIFAPFFVFSYRSKRRMDLSPSELNNLVHDHKNAIPKILRKSRRTSDEELPSQLIMFRGYFDDDD